MADMPTMIGVLPLPACRHPLSLVDGRSGTADSDRHARYGARHQRCLTSLMEYLYFAGDERFGALGVSVSKDQYLPRRLGD